MRQRGGTVVNSQTVFTIVLVIAVFNVVAYLHVKDWNSIAVFLLAGVVTFSVTLNRTLSVVAAVVAGSLFRATNNLMQEGMESKSKSKSKSETPEMKRFVNKKAMKEHAMSRIEAESQGGKYEGMETKSKAAKKGNKYADFLGSEGMSSQLSELQNNQQVLTNGIKALEPLMQQASAMLKGLPSGFLDEALKKLSKNNGQI